MLKSALLNKPVKQSHPIFKQVTLLFADVNAFLQRIDERLDSLSKKIAAEFILPMVQDLNNLISVVAVYLEGMKSSKGAQLMQENEEDVKETVSLVQESFDNIKSQYQSLVADTAEA